jgi:multimeric flavodoxin WrbA
MTKVLVLHYSSYRHIETMTYAEAEGVRATATIAGGSRQPSATELETARFQGRHVTSIAARLAAQARAVDEPAVRRGAAR